MRSDLLSLGEQEFIALANRGLYKRACKELRKGGFQLTYGADGTVELRQGSRLTRLAPGLALSETECSCGSTGLCYHRLLAILAYQAEQAQPTESKDWCPGDFSDDMLKEEAGRSVWRRAALSRSRGLTVELSRGEKPVAFLPTCQVTFLVPDDIHYARCDCAEQGLCEHIVLAVWAFRKEGTRVSFEAGGELDFDFGEAHRLVESLLRIGVEATDERVVASLLTESADLKEQGLLWPSDILSELAEQLRAYQERTALYSSEDYARLLVEWWARTRASGPRSDLLGVGESAETLLEQVGLTCLGVRLWNSESLSWAEAFLAEPNTGVVTVLSQRWSNFLVGPEFAVKRMGQPLTLGKLATSRLVTEAARRQANRLLHLGRSRLGRTSLFHDNGDWGGRFREPLFVNDFEILAKRLREREPWLFRARVVAEDIHVFPVAAVTDLCYAPGSQTLFAQISDEKGNRALLYYPHSSAESGGVSAWFRMLGGECSFLSGAVDLQGGRLRIRPLSVVADGQVFCPALMPDQALPAELPFRVEEEAERPDERAWSVLSSIAHRGLSFRAGSSWEDLLQLAERLENEGLTALAATLSRLHRSGEPEAWWLGGLRCLLQGVFREA